MKNRQQRKTRSSFNKHIKYELKCCVVGSPGGRGLFLDYYGNMLNASGHGDKDVIHTPVSPKIQTSSTGSTGSTEQKGHSKLKDINKNTTKFSHVCQKHITMCDDGKTVYVRIHPVFGSGEQQTSTKALTQQSDCFIISVTGEPPKDHGNQTISSSTGIQQISAKNAEIDVKSDSDENFDMVFTNEQQEAKDKNSQLNEFLLENQSIDYLCALPYKIEQWVDDLQEVAKVDVPIIIYFCTLTKPLTLIEKIMKDRDHTQQSDQAQQKKDIIDNMIQMTKSNFVSYRNIHVFAGSNEIDIEKLMKGDLSEGQVQTQIKVPNYDGTQDHRLDEDKEKRERELEFDLVENKYVLNIDDVIMELSEEQLETVLDSESPKQQVLEQFLKQKLQIEQHQARQSIRELKANLLMLYGDRERSASFSKKEIRSIKENLIQRARSQSLKSEGHQLGGTTGEASLTIQQKLTSPQIFDSNLHKIFHILFEAGYMFKYKDLVWMPAVLQDDEDLESLPESSQSSEPSYIKKMKKSNPDSQKASEEDNSYKPMSANLERNLYRKQSFKLRPQDHKEPPLQQYGDQNQDICSMNTSCCQ